MPKYDVGQTAELNCGAACLLCAALELDAKPVAGTQNDEQNWNTFIGRHADLTRQSHWLDEIYNISRCPDGYSLPSGVVKAAALLGMDAGVIATATNTVGMLEFKYPHEIKKCINLNVYSTRTGSGDLTLGDDERAMHCVRVGNLPFVHWVLQRPDGSYMDPAGGGGSAFTIGGYGGSFASRTAMKSSGQALRRGKSHEMRIKYHGTGLVIKLAKAVNIA